MINIDRVGTEMSWRELPLCGSYLAVIFGAFQVMVRGEGVARGRELRWAFGVLNDGQYEVMGAWATPTSDLELWQEAFEDLKVRGVERVRFVFGCDSAAIKSIVSTAYPGATVISSELASQNFAHGHAYASASVVDGPAVLRAANRSGPGLDAVAISAGRESALSARHRRVVLAGEDQMMRLHRSATRAIGRHGGFADMYSATAFVLDALRSAEHRVGSVNGRVDPAAEPDFDLAAHRRDNCIGSRAVGL